MSRISFIHDHRHENVRPVLEAINAYVDGVMEPLLCKELEEHLKGCDPCQIVIDTLKMTITLFKENVEHTIPLDVHARLHRMLKEEWNK
ncbi:MAG: zf-HC2 domain-containing protein [Armatimonadetes bacterium]|nr:zf-HC2 domain-containing protein [Armatimonadota bacterium]